jgi:excisionase family DNA binding protein
MKRDARNRLGIEWMSLRQITEYANICERTVRAWIHSPVDPLPAVRVSGKILVRRSELDMWLERHRVRPLQTIDLDGILRKVVGGIGHGR